MKDAGVDKSDDKREDTFEESESLKRKRVLKGAAGIIVLTAIVFAALAFFADFDATSESLQRVSSGAILLALVASSANFLFRFFRWTFYLRVIGARVSPAESATIFLSGLAMSVTPGKVGELFKAVAVSARDPETTVEEASAVVIAERAIDLLAVVILVAVGASYLESGQVIAGFSAAFAVMVVLFLSSKTVASFVLTLLRQVKPLIAIADRVESMWSAIQKLNALPVLLSALALSTAAWFGQCVALWVLLSDLGANVHLAQACALYCAPLLAGVVSLIPGGVGAAEATMLALIETSTSLLRPDALAATMLTRLVTLWWAVLVGIYPASLVLRWVHRGDSRVDDSVDERTDERANNTNNVDN